MPLSPERQVEILLQAYRSGTYEIVSNIEKMTSGGRSTIHARAALNETQQILRELDDFADAWIETNVPAAYREGWDNSFKSTLAAYPEGFGAETKYGNFAKINKQALETIAYNLQDTLHGATQMVGRQARDVFRRVTLEATQQQLITGQARRQITATMKEQFVSRGITAFRDKLGRTWSLDAYCGMAGQTSLREANTAGTINRLTAGGYDLVQISEHAPTCDACAPLQGKVFSLRGETPGYPRYEDYIPVHPWCKHVLWSYQPKFDSNAEETRRRSNTSLTSDPRSQAEKDAYKGTQDKKRQERELREQYKRYVARLGEEEVGSIANFAGSKKADSDRWYQLQNDYREAGRE